MKKRSMMRLNHGWCFPFVFVLACLAALDTWALHPSPLVDLAGTWEACAERRGLEPCRPQAIRVPSHFDVASVGADWMHRIEFRKTFATPGNCVGQPCALVIGEVGDSAAVFLNGRPVYQSAEDEGAYTKNLAISALLPAELLNADQDNELVIQTHSMKAEQSGIVHGPVAITRVLPANLFAHWKTFRTSFLPLICSLLAAATALFMCVVIGDDVLRYDVRFFYGYATLSSLFLFSFSEIPRMILPLTLAIPMHFALRFGVDWALFSWIGSFFRTPHAMRTWFSKVYGLAVACVAGVFVWGQLGSAGVLHRIDAPSLTYRVVYGFYGLVLFIPALSAVVHCRRREWSPALCFAANVGVVAHDGLVGFGLLHDEFLSKYYHAVVVFVSALVIVRQKGVEQAEEASRLEIAAKIADLSRQMAHDIRSPLAALNVTLGDLAKPSEQTRVLMRMAISRIQDIANELLRTGKKESATSLSRQSNEPVLLACAIQEIVSEKRVEYRDRLNLAIDEKVAEDAFGLFVQVDAAILKRIVSNLVNNSIEAMPSAAHGRIEVRVRNVLGAAAIDVADNGAGMSAETLSQLGTQGFTSRGASGHGLGVAFTKQSIEAWGGTLGYESEVGCGTTATMVLPPVPPPAWFADRLDLAKVQQIFVLDDDQSIHGIWQARFEQLGVRASVTHMAHPRELQRHLGMADRATLFCLVDYEFLGSRENGLDVIEANYLNDRAYLVTSRYEEKDVVARCLRAGVKIVPKPMAAHVPIVAPEREHAAKHTSLVTDVVLIDNDPLVGSSWGVEARKSGRNLIVYKKPEAFWHDSARLRKSTPIFVDYELGENSRGDAVTKSIADAGFENIFLTTGLSRVDFSSLSWLRGVVGKDPPF